jgi:hypothetical protein
MGLTRIPPSRPKQDTIRLLQPLQAERTREPRSGGSTLAADFGAPPLAAQARSSQTPAEPLNRAHDMICDQAERR